MKNLQKKIIMMNQVGLNSKQRLLLSRKEQESWSSLRDRGKHSR